MPDQTAQEALWAEIRAIPDPGSPGVVRRQEAQDWLECPMRLIVSAEPADGGTGRLENIEETCSTSGAMTANVPARTDTPMSPEAEDPRL